MKTTLDSMDDIERTGDHSVAPIITRLLDSVYIVMCYALIGSH